MRTILYIALASALYFGLKRTVGDWSRSASVPPNKYLLLVSIAAALALILGTERFGEKRPGSFFERSSYEATVYVHLHPGPQTVKSYRVPAVISASVEGEDDQGGQYHSWREYWLGTAFMPSGGRIGFEDCQLRLEHPVTCFDAKNRYWTVVLTSTPVRRGERR